MDETTKKILGVFEQISQIPRQSKHEEAISAWLVNWAKSRGLEVHADEVKNVFVRVPATPAFEDRPVVILQGHMDMVCEKTPDSDHDFRKDPIRFIFDGEWLKADKTTLGADNGIALAYALAIADSELPHPELELVFTVDEETGLSGALALKPNTLKGKVLLNLDSEDEGVFTIGCCGGVDTRVWFPLSYEKTGDGDVSMQLGIGGCKGGHSGGDIVRHRANANKLLVRTLWALFRELPLRLISVSGGTAHNAIPRDAEALISIPADAVSLAEKIVKDRVAIFQNEYKDFEQHIQGSIRKNAKQHREAIASVLGERILRFLLAYPNGIEELDPSVYKGGPLLAETSNNFAVIRTEEGVLRILSSQRSQVMSARDMLTQKIEMLAHLAGAEYQSGNGYSSWQPNWDSLLLKKAIEVYREHFNKEPRVNVIHGGLECGVIGAKHPGMDMISLGPTIENPHSPDERLHIPSVRKVWDLLVELLKVL
ncbi:MAG: aminoacyl-histidine dipeptidase [Candidatus Neomarinimicrobiota bacterium]|jgi:dipeptidase D|nr:aminoacyl-histidine dipeptidase [bacterium]